MSEIKAVFKLSLVEGQVVLCHRDDLNGQFLLKKIPRYCYWTVNWGMEWTGVYGILSTTALQI